MISSSESTAKISTALTSAQAELQNPIYNTVAEGKKFDYDYASLDSICDLIRDVASKHSICVFHSAHCENECFIVETQLLHSSGEFFRITLPFVMGRFEPRVVGGMMTYGRRYSLLAFFNIAAAFDDDIDDMGDVLPPEPKGKSHQTRTPLKSKTQFQHETQTVSEKKLVAMTIHGIDQCETLDELKLFRQRIEKHIWPLVQTHFNHKRERLTDGKD